jgi:hypothetical protein
MPGHIAAAKETMMSKRRHSLRSLCCHNTVKKSVIKIIPIKPGMVVCTYSLSYSRGRGRRLEPRSLRPA